MTPEFERRAESVAEARARRRSNPEVLRIIEQVSHATGFSVAEIVGRRRFTDVCLARDLAAYEAVKAGFSMPMVGRCLNRDHSTILDAVRREAERREEQ